MSSLLTGIQAVIFDMDGTMVRNTADHHAAWNDFLAEHQLHLTDTEYKEKAHGKNNHEILRALFGQEIDEATIHAYGAEKERLYRERFLQHFAPVEGLLPLLTILRERALPLAVATTSCKENRDFILGGLHIEDFFSVISGDEDVTHGKPNPEIYVLTSARLAVLPEHCLVFEDTPAGIHAAKTAGMHVVAVTTSHTEAELSEADMCVSDFNAIPPLL
ncbi:MAG: HAD family phosphatase [Minisyncoccia bacterium]